MTIVFPKNNLPEPAQPWAREVQKQLANVIASNNSNEINNATRDNQLNSSLISLSKVVSDVKAASDEATAALNGLIGLGSAGSEYTLNASNITAGTITGITLQTASFGRRVVLGGTNITFFDDGGDFTGFITASGQSSGSNMKIGAFSNNEIRFDLGNIEITVPGAFMAVAVGDSGVPATAYISGSLISMGGPIETSTRLTTGGNLRSGGTLGRIELGNDNVNATTGASINANGNIIRTASSARYKLEIEDVPFTYEDVLLLRPRTFRLKSEVEGSPSDEQEPNKNARRYAGFIAEEIAETPLSIFVSYTDDDEGNRIPDGVYYQELSAALVLAIKHQDTLIKSLNDRIETLENGA
jgi:hypothetical protein